MSPDVLTTLGLLSGAVLIGLLVRFTEPGGLFRLPVIVRGVRYHHAGRARHARPAVVQALQAPAEPPVSVTIPDPAHFVRAA